MATIETQRCRIYSAQQFMYGLVNNSNQNVYMFMGKTLAWPNEASPPVPTDDVLGHISYWDDMISLKKISPSNMTLVIQRWDWTQSIIYQEYTDNLNLFDVTLGLKPFYVLTDDLNVYKCLFNNNGSPSIYKPTGTSTNIIITPDLYKWKFMFSVNQADAESYLTTEWIPVKVLTISDGSSQFDTQQAAIPGSIDVIEIISGGSGYTTVPAVTITGDGTGATAISIIKNGSISGISLTNRGQNYTNAIATVSSGQVTSIVMTSNGIGYISAPAVLFNGGGGSGAAGIATVVGGQVTMVTITNPGSGYTSSPNVSFSVGNATATSVISGGVVLRPIMSPPGGHGSDPVTELGGFSVMIQGQFAFNEGNFSISNDFRRIGLVSNPMVWNINIPYTAITANQCYSFYLTNVVGSSFLIDQQIVGETSGAIGYVLDYNSGTFVLRLINISGIFIPGETLTNGSTTGLLQTATGTAIAGTSSSITLASSDHTSTNGYKNFTIQITGGTGFGQQNIISLNTYNGFTNVASVEDPWTITPDSTSAYSIAEIIYPNIQPDTGYILYVENRRATMRSATQLENLKLVLDF